MKKLTHYHYLLELLITFLVQRYAERLNYTNLFNQMGLFFSQSLDLYFLKKPENQKVYRNVWMFLEKILSLPPQKPLKTILLILLWIRNIGCLRSS